MPKKSWRSTKIFVEIKKRRNPSPQDDHSPVETFLANSQVLDAIETIIDKGGTTPKDFTLHDADHSFRVADRMWELIPQTTQDYLSEFELALLLLSAYLHDIGMSPGFDLEEKHRKYLTEQNSTDLTDEQINELQKWIDNTNELGQIDVRKNKVTSYDELTKILKYYIRHKHNDWSGQWIEKNLLSIPLPGYPSIIKDLILVCKSHHYGFDYLLKDSFDLKPLGNNTGSIYLRYLAMCLRVADVMENDPDRTPDILLQHRFINEDSLIYWIKDSQYVLNRVENNRVIEYKIHARPTKAYIHKAIEETVDNIQAELRLCDELTKKKPFDFIPLTDGHKYTWNLIPYITKEDIQPYDQSYIYFKGAFRPNTSKILEILGGHQLYGDPVYAFRELVQNSFDAVKEKIAYKLLGIEGFSKDHVKSITELSSIAIKLEHKENNWWLSITDTGVGMTQQVIEKFFLESGSSKRHEISELERNCKTKGINFNRTGQFGIGVLSYFMLADLIVLKTKRSQDTGYPDEYSKGLRFEINGLHDFGELVADSSVPNGTTIALKLKKQIVDQIFEWNRKWSDYLKSGIIISPCKISYLSGYHSTSASVSSWTNTKEDITKQLIEQFKAFALNHTRIDPLTSSREDTKIRNENKRLFDECVVELNDKIDYEIFEDDIPEFGQFRIHFPYFNLEKGRSLIYVKEHFEDGEHHLSKIGNGYWWKPKFNQIIFSLKGVKINAQWRPNNDTKGIFSTDRAYIEINIDKANTDKLSVSRNNIDFDDRTNNVINGILKKADEFLLNKFEKFDNCYSSLSTNLFTKAPAKIFWAINAGQNKVSLPWQEICFPVLGTRFMTFLTENVDYKYRNKPLSILKDLPAFMDGSNLNWLENAYGNYNIGVIDENIYVWPILSSMPNKFVPPRLYVSPLTFPAEGWFIDIFKLHEKDYMRIFINDINPHFPFFDASLYRYYTSKMLNNLIETFQEIGNKKVNNYTFLVCTILFNESEDKWKGFCERNESLIGNLFKNADKQCFVVAQDARVFIYTANNVSQLSSNKFQISKFKDPYFKVEKTSKK